MSGHAADDTDTVVPIEGEVRFRNWHPEAPSCTPPHGPEGRTLEEDTEKAVVLYADCSSTSHACGGSCTCGVTALRWNPNGSDGAPVYDSTLLLGACTLTLAGTTAAEASPLAG